ncbi:MAG: hypothetical protein Kow0069_15060 [Promethearchaeota archaeon]
MPPSQIADLVAADPLGFAEIVLLAVVSITHFLLGAKFFLSSRAEGLLDTQRRVDQGYGAWFVAIGAGHGTYSLDRFWRFFHEGARLFATHEERVVNRDYLVLSFFFLYLAFMFLTHTIETQLLGRKPVLAVVCGAMGAFSLAYRFVEDATIDPVDPPGLASDVMGYALYSVLFVVFVLIIGLYAKIAGSAPEGSRLKKKALAAIVGILVWVVMLVAGNNQFSKASWFTGVNLLGPVITLVALAVLNYGLTKV